MSAITSAVRNDLAPTGTLRAAINYGNFILATRDKTTGETRGVAIDLANELARRLDVPLELVAYDLVGVMVEAAPTNAWDIAFLGSDPLREHLVRFTGAYLEIEATYLVPTGSPLRTADEVDQAGRRVSAPAKANYELYLRRNLARAELVSADGTEAAVSLLTSGKVDALAGLKQALIGLVEKMPAYRMLDGRFMAVQQSIGVPKGRDAGLAFLRQVVEDAKRSGLVARAIERTGARGVNVAP
jgi:polar amino acid transport system substrate-binding protein